MKSKGSKLVFNFAQVLSLGILILLYQNCGDVRISSGVTAISSEITPPFIEETPPTLPAPPAAIPPYQVQRANRLLFAEDLYPGARGRIEIRDYNNQVLKSVVGPRPDNQYGSGLLRTTDLDGDGIEDFAFSNPYNHEYGFIEDCKRMGLDWNTPAPCQANTDTYYRIFDERVRAPKPSVFVYGSRAESFKRVDAKDSFPHGRQLLEIGDLDGDGLSEILVSYHFPGWFGLVSSRSNSMTYIQIPHGQGSGVITRSADIDRDGVKEVWHSHYDPYTKTQHFSLLNIAKKNVLAKLTLTSANKDARLLINEETEDLNRDGFVDFILSDSLTKISVISGKELMQRNQMVELSSIPLMGKSSSILVGDFHPRPGIEVASTIANKLSIHSLTDGQLVFEDTFEGAITLQDKADGNGDGYDDLLYSEYGNGGVLNRSRVYSPLAENRVLHSFQNLSQIYARYFLRERRNESTPANTIQLSAVNSVPEEAKCARNGARLLIQPNGWQLSGYTFNEFGSDKFYFNPLNTRVVLGKKQYYSVPFKPRENQTMFIVTAPDGALAPAFSSAYVTISECPGDFREKMATPPADEPTLSIHCRLYIGNEIDQVLFSTARLDRRCELDPNKTYFFNVIQSHPNTILNGGDNSTCEFESCSYLQNFRG